MTAKFDKKASDEVLQSLMMIPSTIDGTEHPSDMVVVHSTVKEARGYISAFHYSHTMPDSTLYVFKGTYRNGETAGFCVFGMGCGMNQYRTISPDIEDGEYCELTRLWLFDKAPKNSESRLISESLKLLPKSVRLVLSYADSRQSHEGTIYKATNWIQSGMTNGGKILVNEEGKEFHSRLLQIYKIRHPETYGNMSRCELMDALGLREIEAGKKHRFVKIINVPKSYRRKFEESVKQGNQISFRKIKNG